MFYAVVTHWQYSCFGYVEIHYAMDECIIHEGAQPRVFYALVHSIHLYLNITNAIVLGKSIAL